MSFIKSIFGKKEKPISTIKEFWDWFLVHEAKFYSHIKNGDDIEGGVFEKLSPKIDQLYDGIYFVVGMLDNNTAELVLSAEGVIKNIPFVEKIIQSAPNLERWKFTALKPSIDIENVTIHMNDYFFSQNNMSFYVNEHEKYPDEVDLVIVHDDYSEENRDVIINGAYIFLDHYLGEYNAVTMIDSLNFDSKSNVKEDLIPIEKLESYLIWREKEFVEKYEGYRYDIENDTYSSLEATTHSGKPWIAIVNSTLLEWDNKASHPWILKVVILYEGNHETGLPDKNAYAQMDEIEDEILLELKSEEGYLNVGRQTADNQREIYFACQDFRKPSLVLHNISKSNRFELEISYDIYRDKYWMSLERFIPEI